MHPILAKIDDLDAAIGNSADLAGPQSRQYRRRLSDLAADIRRDLETTRAPGSTEVVNGATITHRPDLAYQERARQAAV